MASSPLSASLSKKISPRPSSMRSEEESEEVRIMLASAADSASIQQCVKDDFSGQGSGDEGVVMCFKPEMSSRAQAVDIWGLY